MSTLSERVQVVFRRAERDLLRLRSGQQGARVHAFRTTTRRLQTLLEEVISRPDRNQKKLLKMLHRLRKRTGKVRDVDVQLAALRSLKISQEPRRKTQLTQHFIELREKHEKRLRKLLSDKRVREIQKRLRRAFKDTNLKHRRDPLVVAREMLAQVERPVGAITEDVLHRYRVAVKRARYAAEFAPKSSERTQFIAELKKVQDAIGSWHDWFTLTHGAALHLGEVNESSLVAALHNVTRGKFRGAIAALSASSVIQPKLDTVPAKREHSHRAGPQGEAEMPTESAA